MVCEFVIHFYINTTKIHTQRCDLNKRTNQKYMWVVSPFYNQN